MGATAWAIVACYIGYKQTEQGCEFFLFFAKHIIVGL